MPPEGFPTHYRTNDRVSFPRELSEGEAMWWQRAIREHTGVYPDDLPRFLASGVEGRITGYFTEFNARTEVFELGVECHGADNARIAFKHKRFEVAGGLINSGETRVHPDWQGRGIGTKMMLNLIEFAGAIKAKRIDIEAQDIGRYAWVPLGFLPDKTSWVDRIIPRAVEWARAAYDRGMIAKTDFEKVLDITKDKDPRFARELAALRTEVDGLDQRGQPARLPLGKAIMLQPGTDWFGSFEFDDDTLNYLDNYRRTRDARSGAPNP